MWPFLFACAAPVEAPPPPTPSSPLPDEPTVYTLVGRATPTGLDSPSLPGGTALLGKDCVTVNQALHGEGPPCFVEDWVATDTIRVLRSGSRLTIQGKRGRTRWSQLDGVLAFCLGDPLDLPPAHDPAGLRWMEGTSWMIRLSGANRCALAGGLRLDTTRDVADWDQLTAGGLPWGKGGLAHAREAMRAAVRDIVAHRWDELDADARADALRTLAEDPSPEAKALRTDRLRGLESKRRK